MKFTKIKEKILHDPSAIEVFYCLSSMPQWSRLLLHHSPTKPYARFLQWLVDNSFYKGATQKITITKIARDLKSDSGKISRWIHLIYKDILELNDKQPNLFCQNGIRANLFIQQFDNFSSITLSFPVLPRQYETFEFPFIKGKIGTSRFWVKKVAYLLENNDFEITIWLQGGTVNKFREFALDKALFQNKIHFMDVFEKQDFEIDEKLEELNRNK